MDDVSDQCPECASVYPAGSAHPCPAVGEMPGHSACHPTPPVATLDALVVEAAGAYVDAIAAQPLDDAAVDAALDALIASVAARRGPR